MRHGGRRSGEALTAEPSWTVIAKCDRKTKDLTHYLCSIQFCTAHAGNSRIQDKCWLWILAHTYSTSGLCRRPDFGQKMVACSNDDCPISHEWFHYGCVGLSEDWLQNEVTQHFLVALITIWYVVFKKSQSFPCPTVRLVLLHVPGPLEFLHLQGPLEAPSSRFISDGIRCYRLERPIIIIRRKTRKEINSYFLVDEYLMVTSQRTKSIA